MTNVSMLPGWVETGLGDILQLSYGKSLPERKRSGYGFPVYGSNGIVGYHDSALTKGETLVIGRKGSLGQVNFSPGPCFPIDTTYYVDELHGMPSRYWFYLLTYLRLGDLNKATTIPGLNREDVYRIIVPVAPLNEQKRIADKLDALLARVDACRERLDHVLFILKRFRQVIFDAATSGQLTEDWRDENGYAASLDENDGNTSSFEFTDASCFGDYRFPASWEKVRLGDIADVTSGITKDSKKQSPSYEEIPYLRVANVQRGYLDLRDLKSIRVPQERLDDLLLKPGDILFNEGGDIDKLGRGWVWSGELERCVFQNHVFRARLRDSSFNPKFFSFYGNSRGFDYFLAYGKQTTNLASISKSVLISLPIVVPPAEEQHEIVSRIESLFAYADRLEIRHQAAIAQVERLSSALLSKAFRGELVPQDPNDEPASLFLERLRAVRASMTVQLKKPRWRSDMGKKDTKKETASGPIGIVQAMRQVGKELSANDLLLAAGYPGDADSELLEEFFVAVRDALKSNEISKTRRRDVDWFSLT